MNIELVFKNDLRINQVTDLIRRADEKAKILVAVSLLNWVVNGSAAESTVPPVLDGILRGSGSAFLGSKLVAETPQYNGNGNPNRSHSENEGVVTIGFDTAYAAKMHETEWNPGPVSQQSGDTGNKFVSKHLEADKADLLKLYAMLLKKEIG